jgi:hypothetical protein
MGRGRGYVCMMCVGPLGGTQYDIYVANWIYSMRMLVLDVQTWPRRDVPGLGLTDRHVGLLRGGWIVTSLLMVLI